MRLRTRLKSRRGISLGLSVALLSAWIPSANAQVLASCNYSFPTGPYEDRGSVQVMQETSRLVLQFVEDDEVTQIGKIVASRASGDQARELIARDKTFKTYVLQARIFAEEIDHVDAYVAPSAEARYFVFYGKDQKYLGGFGTHGKTPFMCDWVGT